MLKKIKEFFMFMGKIVLFVLSPAFLFYRFVIKKPDEHINIKKKVNKTQQDTKEVLKSNENTDKFIDKQYNDYVNDHKSFKSRAELRRRKKNY